MKIIFLLITIAMTQPTVDRTRADRKVARITDADFRSDMEAIIDDLETNLN